MDLNAITVSDFKAQFRRDFPYLPSYNPEKLYNAGVRVYYADSDLFYECSSNGTQGIDPTDATKWQQVADDLDNYVLDEDISKAFAEAQFNLNQGLFSSDANIKIAYLYLTAHYLANDLKTALAGFMGAGGMPITNRSVGNVSESYGIPKAYLESPQLSFYTSSGYGLKYLSFVLPLLVGNMSAVGGATLP